MLPEPVLDSSAERILDLPAPARVMTSRSTATSNERPRAEIFQAVWRRQWILWVFLVLAMIGAFVFLSQATPVYQATSKLDILKGGNKIIAETVQQQSVQSSNALYADSQIIQSTAIVQDAVNLGGLADLATLRGMENPVPAIQSALKAVPDPQGEILNLSFQSTRSDDAAVVVNAVVDAYINFIRKQSQTSASAVLKILQGEKAKREIELADLQKKMIDFQRANGILSFDDSRSSGGKHAGDNIITTRLAELSELHTKAEVDLLNADLAMKTVDAMKSDRQQLSQWVQAQSMLNQPDNPRVSRVQVGQDIASSAMAVDRLQDRYGPDHPLVVSARRQIGLLEQQGRQMQERIVDDYVLVLTLQLSNARQREQELQKQLDTQRGLALDLNGKVAEFSQLGSDETRTERMLDILDNRIKEVDVNSDSHATVNILETGKPSPIPVFPNRSRVLGMALVIGLMLGIGTAVLADRLDHRLRSADEMSELLGLPVLGVIPRMEKRITAKQRGQVVRLQPRSDISEAYRTLRTALYFGTQTELRTILVTSPMPGDGKSTCASNLALALAQADHKVLLIDCDFRKPVQHKQFGIENKGGVSDILSGNAAWSDMLKATAAERLQILPCGRPPENPAELLNSQGFRQLLSDLSLQYDKIVIDSPPLIPVTDARILSTIADVSVLVVRAERSTRRGIEHARDALMSVGGSLIGSVVNDTPRSGFGYYYNYGYKGGYRYGHRYYSDDSQEHNGTSGIDHVREPHKALT